MFTSFLWCLVDMANKKKGAPKDSLHLVPHGGLEPLASHIWNEDAFLLLPGMPAPNLIQ